MSNSSHDYHGPHASRALRKLGKLGPGIVSAERLEELLRVKSKDEAETDYQDEGGEG